MSHTAAEGTSDYRQTATAEYFKAREAAGHIANLFEKLPLRVSRAELRTLVEILNVGVGELAVKLATAPGFSARLARVAQAFGETDQLDSPIHYPVQGGDSTTAVLHAMCITATYSEVPVSAELPGAMIQVDPGIVPAEAVAAYDKTRADNRRTSLMQHSNSPWQ